MATAVRNMHEVLGPYLSPISPPTAVSVPNGTQTRLPVAPSDAIPGGLRPIPTTTQSNKKTNVQIPYMRRATEAQGVAGVWGPSVAEGSIAFVERQQLVPHDHRRANGMGPNAFVDVYSVEQVNEAIKELRVVPYTYDDFPYRLDGVVNNVDGADASHEFKDHTIVNMAVQGHCRLDHRAAYRADEEVAKTSATIYVGLFATRERLVGGGGYTDWVHRLERFSSNMVTRDTIDLGDETMTTLRFLAFAWVVGRVVDPAQSKSMLTIHVDVRPVRYIDPGEAQPYQPPDPANAGVPTYVLRWQQEWDAANRRHVTTPAVFGDPVTEAGPRQQLLACWTDA